MHAGPAEYQGGHQIWMSDLDSNGFLYFLTNDNIIQHDGASWRSYPILGGRYHLLVDERDRIHVIGRRDFGYFEASDDGTLHFQSLRARLPSGVHEVGESQSILSFGRDTVYCTDRYIFLLRPDGGLQKVAESVDAGFREAFVWQGALYVAQDRTGLWRLSPGSEQPLQAVTFEDGEPLEEDVHVEALVPWDETSALLLTLASGAFLLRDGTLEPKTLPADTYLHDKRPRHALRTSDGRILVTTTRGGAVFLDDRGQILEVLNSRGSEPINDTVYHASEDRWGNFWFATDTGIFRIPRSSTQRIVEPRSVEGTMHRTLRYGDALYLATRASLLRKRLSDPRGDIGWQTLISQATWFLVADGDDVLAAANDGIYAISETGVERFCSSQTISLYRSRYFPGQWLAATRQGLRPVFRQNGTWRCGELLDGIPEFIYEAVDGDDGEMILRSWESVLYVVDTRSMAEGNGIQTFDLPEGTNDFLRLDGEIWLSNQESGLFRYTGVNDAGSFPFEQDASLGRLLGGDLQQMLLLDYEEDTRRLWLVHQDGVEVAQRLPNGAFERREVASDQLTFWCDIHRDPQVDRYWLTNGTGVFLWDPGVRRPGPLVSTHLRRVLRLPSGEVLPWTDEAALPYEDNSLRFEFAAPIFDQLTPIEYQYRLEGFDDDWSAKTPEPTKEYLNLREGSYRFRVRAVDRWGAHSGEASQRFTIRPPFHRSTPAFVLYALGLCGVVLLAVRGHRRTLDKERAINQRLREVDRLKDEFLANTSHELRTPLHGITGLAESLIDGAAGETSGRVQENLAVIVASGRRLSHLVDDILDFSKLRHHRLALDCKAVDLRSLTEVVLTLSRSLVGSRPLELRNEVPKTLPAAHADENRLQQILFNLVGNAIKFTESGSVTVLAERVGERLMVRVRDTGIGIPEDQQKRIFRAFEQLDAARERRYAGTGLGLAVTSQLVALHGGELQVASQPGEGAIFSFDLALAEGAPQATDEDKPSVGLFAEDSVTIQSPFQTEPMTFPEGEPTARLLVVDDEPVNLRVLANFLAGENFALTLASSGAEALERIDDQRFDLVLLDVMMPGMSGYEVCQRIRQQFPVEKLPIVILSALDRPEERVIGLGHGANDYLTKPVVKGELISRVHTHLELLKAHRRSEDEVASLQGLLPICMTCKNIRDDAGYWNQLEQYISRRSEAEFTHTICPPCAKEMLASLDD